jgi:hypothetical protein
MSEIASSA